MADLTQNVTVNLNGSGDLAVKLGEARAQAQDLSKAVDSAKKSASTATSATAIPNQPGRPAATSATAIPNQPAQAGASSQSLAGGEWMRLQRLHEAKVAAERETAAKAIAAERDKARETLNRRAAWAAGGGMGLIGSTVGLFNPWAVERFSKASRDLGATIGRDLLPYLEAGTRIIRAAADAWAKMPSGLRSAAAGAIAAGTVLGIVGLAFRGMTVAAQGITGTVGLVTKGLWGQTAANRALVVSSEQAAAAASVQAAMNQRNAAAGATAAAGSGRMAMAGRAGMYGLLAYGGYEAYKAARSGSDKGDGSSFGMAVAQPQLSSIEGYLDSIQVEALKSTARNSEKSADLLEKIFNKMGEKGTAEQMLTGAGVNAGVAEAIGFASPALSAVLDAHNWVRGKLR